MPFTANHPALIVPLLRSPLPAAALVIGSVVPDLPLYLPVDVPLRTHTLVSLPTTDLALGLASWAVWHALLAPAATATAPPGLRSRLAAPTGLRAQVRPRRCGTVVAALLAGSATHLLWDEFTHAERWGTRHVPALAGSWHGVPGYRWAQYASEVVGALVVAGSVVSWWRRTPPAPRPLVAAAPPGGHTWPWALVAGAGLAAGSAAALSVGSPLRDAAVAGAKNGGTAAVTTALTLAVAFAVARATRRERARRVL